ncbi:vWA domain-containing protein [Fervidicoccus fontis]|uniref:VWA domain-containing protein n=1 Tax=Fervidicoccus fontis (strain DSM 19380 / JCM 18336 / VKM B-2539 / Kam940) TaxID=1163730 RepID=I0A0K0_FERFK|nr:vWA domain-containing protein [Fervidicoccus fontis]AFH42507.1 hypothetical protein FFONT_0517 [Fervidicoccus fontis Kam940]
MLSDEINLDEVISIVQGIAGRLRERNVLVSTSEIENAVKLYITATQLSPYGYFPLKPVIESVFVKRKYDEEIFNDAWRDISKVSYGEKIRASEKPKEKLLKGKRIEEKEEHESLDIARMQKLSVGKLRKMGKFNEENKRKLEIARKINTLQKYYETGNRGYIDLLESELKASQKKKGSYESKDSYSASSRYEAIEKLLFRIVENPDNANALLALSKITGSDLPIEAIKYFVKKRKTFLVEKIAASIFKRSGGLLKGKKYEKGYIYGRVDIRKTLFELSRNHPEELVFKQKKRENGAILVIDKSDSMRKRSTSVIKIASQYYPFLKSLILFDTEVKVKKISRSSSRWNIVKDLLSMNFSGYTNISKALRQVIEISKPKDTVIIISDMEQTVEDEFYISLIDKLIRKKVRLIIFTSEEYAKIFKQIFPSSVNVKLIL